MERLSHASRLIADIRLDADRLLEALFVSTQPHQSTKPLHLIINEEVSMRQHLQDLRAIDVLELAGIPHLTSATPSGGKHVEFVSIDKCKEENGGPYKASIPLSQVTNLVANVLLAYEMNGEYSDTWLHISCSQPKALFIQCFCSTDTGHEHHPQFIPDKLRPGSSSTLPERSASSSPAGNSQLHCAPQESTSSDESVDVILDVDESLSESSPSTSSDSLGDDELMSLPVDKALVRAMLSHLVEKVDNADNA
ncbi:sulfite oxidase, partial [Sarracenia purpurea var. burkii]